MALLEMKKDYILTNKNLINKFGRNPNNSVEKNLNEISNSWFSAEFSMKEILDDLGYFDICCRMRLITATNFFE
jgi:DNA-directed RNA polymerase subunit N (RpoN/RPB10)